MDAQAGDTIVVDAHQTGQLPREGEILEVTESPSGLSFEVRWEDGPDPVGALRVIPRIGPIPSFTVAVVPEGAAHSWMLLLSVTATAGPEAIPWT